MDCWDPVVAFPEEETYLNWSPNTILTSDYF